MPQIEDPAQPGAALLNTDRKTLTAPELKKMANFRTALISILAAGIGLLAGVLAYVLQKLIAFLTTLIFYHRLTADSMSPRDTNLGLWIVIVPALGGIVVGFMAKYGSSKIKGHGIPEAMEAVLFNRSRIQPRVAILKPLSAAIAIGTGGPFGAEGPIIQTGGAVGSLVGQVLHTTASERKVLLACGAAAGMSATFSTPIAGVILAIELLLFEFRSRSFIPLVIASTLAAAIHMQLLGVGPMFKVAPMNFDIPRALPFYALLGVLCGLAAAGFSKALYWVEDQFERLPVDDVWWPAIGGLGLGVIGYFVPRVLGVGYDTIGDILNANLGLKLLIVLMLAKSVALMISLGSGTSGGLLAPMFLSSAALGGVFSMAMNKLVPGAALSAGAFALVAMGAVFGAASRATFAFIIFAFEITRDYNSVLPLMLVSVIADGIAILLMPKASIMTEKLARRGLRIHQEFEPDILQQFWVADVMQKQVPTLAADMRVGELAERVSRHQPPFVQHHAFVLVDKEGKLQGVITRQDVYRALEMDPLGESTLLEAGSRNPLTAYVDESLHEAVARMVANEVGRLPVVARDDNEKIVGFLERGTVMAARLHRLREEHELETGWLGRLSWRAALRQ